MESTTLRKGGRAGGYPVRSETLHHGAKSTYPTPRNKAVYSGFITVSIGFPIRPAIKAWKSRGVVYVGGFRAPGWRAINMEGVEDAHNVWSIWAIFWERPTNVWSTQLAVNSSGIVHQQKSALKKLQIQRPCCRKNCPVLCEKSRTPVTWPNCFDRILGNRILEQDV